MIQRIQTVYLLLIFGLMAAMLFLPEVVTVQSETIPAINWKSWCESSFTALLAFTAIFLYKNRKMQLNVCWVILLLLVLSYMVIIFDLWLPNSENVKIVFNTPVVFPAFAIVLDILAILAIRKDEELIRSADRLR
jgi:hypothetical protein